MDGWIVIAIGALYAGLLFGVAWLGDQPRIAARLRPHEPTLYALGLAVYCTSWTFFGAVGTAAVSGWDYLPIYLGPALVFLAAPGFLRRIIAISQRHNVATPSDFLAARYGRSRKLAAAATLLATAGALPYVALQLKSLAMSFEALQAFNAAGPEAGPDDPSRVGVLLVAIILAVFTIVYGARSADASGRNRGLVLAIALESLVKITALTAVAVVAALHLNGGAALDLSVSERFAQTFPIGSPTLTFLTLTGLSMAVIFCLPRQFHMMVTEAPEDAPSAFKRARWLFPVYLAITSIVVIPITLAGAAMAPGVAPDLYVLAVPVAAGSEALATFAFIGGLSAATGMVVIAMVALSTMVTQDLVIPAVLGRRRQTGDRGPAGAELLTVRRWVIAALMALSYGYWLAAGESGALADMGLIAFVAAAQLAPAMLGGVYWSGGHRDGALWGLAAGGAAWAYTLVAPAILGEAGLAASGLQTMLGGLIDPYNLVGGGALDPITHGALVSLAVNTGVYIVVSSRARPRLVDTVQAAAFTRHREDDAAHGGETPHAGRAGVTVGDLRSLAERFLTREAARRAFHGFARQLQVDVSPRAAADWRLVQKTERLLAGALGSSTARIVLNSALSQGDVTFADMLSVLDETSEERRFKRHLLQATLENITQGVSVVDRELRLIAWNGVYLELFQFPAGLVQVGRPIEDLIRYNAERGEMGPGDVEEQVRRRLDFLRQGGPHAFERVNRDGRALKIVGSPMPGGGYVTTFTDITADKRAEQALRDAKASLELRVAERTQDLAAMADDLDRARQVAERSEVTKTRFLAAASHDLQQPLNAARLFASALGERLGGPDTMEGRLAANLDRSIRSAHQMITGLLDLSKFDQGGLRPTLQSFSLTAFFDEIAHDHRPIAEDAGLSLRVRSPDIWVETDRDLLRSVVQNLVSNALRYTESGGVLVAARRRDNGARALIEVWDTGPGVPPEAEKRIFMEFRRLHAADRQGARGAGLGLAIAARAADLMGARVEVRSRLGRGSVFSVSAPMVAACTIQDQRAVIAAADRDTVLEGLRVLCVDDEPSVRTAMSALLSAWGCVVMCADTAEQALAALQEAPFDVLLLDYHLGDGAVMTGLELLRAARERTGGDFRAALLSAVHAPEVAAQARREGCAVFAKPVDARALRAFLANPSAVAAE